MVLIASAGLLASLVSGSASAGDRRLSADTLETQLSSAARPGRVASGLREVGEISPGSLQRDIGLNGLSDDGRGPWLRVGDDGPVAKALSLTEDSSAAAKLGYVRRLGPSNIEVRAHDLMEQITEGAVSDDVQRKLDIVRAANARRNIQFRALTLSPPATNPDALALKRQAGRDSN